MVRFNRGFDLDGYIRELPNGLERATLRVLQFHSGRGNAISRGALVAAVQGYIATASDRAVRLVINQLRKDGFPICSTGGIDGGYWIAGGPEELDAYLDREVVARLSDLQEQVSALRATRKALWGEGVQVRMF